MVFVIRPFRLRGQRKQPRTETPIFSLITPTHKARPFSHHLNSANNEGEDPEDKSDYQGSWVPHQGKGWHISRKREVKALDRRAVGPRRDRSGKGCKNPYGLPEIKGFISLLFLHSERVLAHSSEPCGKETLAPQQSRGHSTCTWWARLKHSRCCPPNWRI